MVDLYGDFGAYQSTGGAACTIAVAIEGGRLISGSIQVLRNVNGFLRAEGDAKLAPFAQLLVNLYITFSHNVFIINLIACLAQSHHIKVGKTRAHRYFLNE
jgi:hypothetical protein